MLGLIAQCIIGIFNSSDLYESFRAISCSSVKAIYAFAYGEEGIYEFKNIINK